MAYRRSTRTARGSGKSRSYSGARRSRSTNSRKAAPRARSTKGRRASSSKVRKAPARAKQQELRIVIAHETPSTVQRPAGVEGAVLADQIVSRGTRKARF